MSDMISCGPGEDTVLLGPTDKVTDGSCEHTFLLAS